MTRPAVDLQRDQTGDMVFESPAYRVKERINEIELRRYDPPWTPWFLRRKEILVGLRLGSRLTTCLAASVLLAYQ